MLGRAHQLGVEPSVDVWRHVLQPCRFRGAVGKKAGNDAGNLCRLWAFHDLEQGGAGLREKPGDGRCDVGVGRTEPVGYAVRICELGKRREGDAACCVASGAHAVEIALPGAAEGAVAAI